MSILFFKRADLVDKGGGLNDKIVEVSNSGMVTPQKRIQELDGLRGIAVIMVIGFHYINNQLINSSSNVGKILYKLTSFGWVGVDLFFVLSGFLIGSILINNRSSKNYFSTFYIRRIVRIIPNYYLLILLFAIVSSIPLFSSNYFLAGNNVIPIWAYLLMIHNILIGHLGNFGNTSISITWSIGVEEQFYIIFPFLVFLLKERWLPWLLGLAIIIAPFARMYYTNWIPAYVLLHCRMDSIAFGIMIAYINCYYSLNVIVKKYILIIGTILMLDCLISIYLFRRFGDLGAFRNTLFAIIFSGMIALALVYKNTIYGSILRWSKLVWIGNISYSLYLFHDIILGICKVLFRSESEHSLENIKGLCVSIFALCISIGFSRLIYKKLETPFVSFGKRFKY